MPRVDSQYTVVVKCVDCGRKTFHSHAHECFYFESTHIIGTEGWVCSACDHKITSEESSSRRLGLMFFHDK